MSRNTISSFEQGKVTLIRATRAAIQTALESGGVGFLDGTTERGPGVYLRAPLE